MSTFQLADNGKWYENAIIGQRLRWFIAWDNDTPELIIRYLRPAANKLPKQYVQPEELLANLPFKVIRKTLVSERRFPGRYGLIKSAAYDLKQTGPIPSRLIVQSDRAFNKRPTTEGVYFDGKS